MPTAETEQIDMNQNQTVAIDLPEPDNAHEEVTLPELDFADDLLDLQGDKTGLMDINAAPVPDFVKEMAAEEGLDWDLELELENLTFQEDQMVAQKLIVRI